MVTLRIRPASVRLLAISRQVNRHRDGTVFYPLYRRQIAPDACLILDWSAATLIPIFNRFIPFEFPRYLLVRREIYGFPARRKRVEQFPVDVRKQPRNFHIKSWDNTEVSAEDNF